MAGCWRLLAGIRGEGGVSHARALDELDGSFSLQVKIRSEYMYGARNITSDPRFFDFRTVIFQSIRKDRWKHMSGAFENNGFIVKHAPADPLNPQPDCLQIQ